MTPTSDFLLFNFAVNLFRTLMYIFSFEHVNKVKLSAKGWADENVREVMAAHTTTIRLFMAFRATISCWGIYLEESHMKNMLCALLFYFDFYILMDTMIIGKIVKRSDAKVLLHHDIKVPVLLQSTFIVAGVITYLRMKFW